MESTGRFKSACSAVKRGEIGEGEGMQIRFVTQPSFRKAIRGRSDGKYKEGSSLAGAEEGRREGDLPLKRRGARRGAVDS